MYMQKRCMKKMTTQEIKEAVSRFLEKEYKVLDLFYKIPGDYEFTNEEWEKFNLVPDLLLKSKEKLHLSFVITELAEMGKIKEFIEKYSTFLPFKIFFVKDNELSEVDTKSFSNKFLGKIEPLIPITSLKKNQFTPKKAEDGKWERYRNLGKRGEEEVIKYLKSIKTQVLDLNFNSPDDKRTGIEDWRKFNKLPDAIAKDAKDIFFVEAKGKTGRFFIVNERDYKLYQEKMDFMPVKIYFVYLSFDGKQMKEMYVHIVNKKEHKKEFKEHDKNWVVDLSEELEQIA